MNDLVQRVQEAAQALMLGDKDGALQALRSVCEALESDGAEAIGLREVQELVGLWKRHLPQHPQPMAKLAPGVRDRLLEALRRERGRDWEATMQRVAASDFLSGSTGFRPSIVWVCAKGNLAKIDAGNYDNAHAGFRSKGQSLVIEATKALDILTSPKAKGLLE